MELKPCPFCGGKAKLVISSFQNSDTTQWHKIMCENAFDCGAEIGTAISGWSAYYEKEVEQLKARWNRRAD